MGTSLFDRLDSVRRRVRRVLWMHGSAWIAAAVIAVVIVAGLTDWMFHVSSGFRILFLGLLAAAIVWTARKYLLAPLRTRITDLELALKVEQQHPDLDPDLAAAVEFLKVPEGDIRAGSKALREQVVMRALAKSEPVNFADIVQPKPARKMLAWAAGAAGVGLALTVASPSDAAIALRRLANPLSGPAWPKRTQIQSVQAADRVALGDPFEVDVKLAGVLPDRVLIRYRFAGDEKSAPDLLRETKDNVFRGGMETVSRSFEYSVSAGDDQTLWKPVAVVPAPETKSLVVRIDYPKYTRMPSETFPAGRGHVKAVVGSEVTVTAEANKPLETAELLLDEAGSIPAALSADARTATAKFVVQKDTHYQVVLRDTEGMNNAKRSPARFRVEAIPDRPPEVTVQKPPGDVDATPNAVLPIASLIKDDFGVGRIDLLHKPPVSASSAGENKGPETTISLADPKDSPKRQPIAHEWPLSSLGLRPGQVLSFHIRAADLRDLPPGPNVAKSREIHIRIVTRDDLLKTLETDQQLVREELQRLLKLQETAMSQTSDLQKQAEVDGKLRATEFEKLQSTDMLQRRIKEKVADSEQSLQREIARLLDQLRANGVQDVETDRRLKMMKSELARLAEQHLPPIAQAMNNAMKSARGEETSQAGQAGQDSQSEPNKEANKDANSASQKGESNSAKSGSQSKAGSKSKSQSASKSSSKAGDSKSSQAGSEKSENAEKSQAGGESQSGSEASESGQGQSKSSQGKSGKSAKSGKSGETKPASPEKKSAEPKPTAQELADARKHQQEVVDSLGQMLEQLEKWETIAQVATDARDLKRRQEEVSNQSNRLSQETLGKPKENLSTEQKQNLAGASAKQSEAADQLQRLERKIDRLAERSSKEDPVASASLKEAMEQIKKSNLGGQMKDAAENVAQNRMSEAGEQQQSIEKSLDKLLESLDDRREQELSRLVKQLKEAEGDLAQMREEQKRLLQKTREAEKIVDPEKRKEELKRLGRQQQQLQKKTAEFARRLSRLRADDASKRADRASSRMDRSGQQMQQGDSQQAGEQQEQAEEQLAEAQQQLAQERRKREDELAREQLAKVSDSIKQIYDRQIKVKDETIRLENLRASKGRWSRGELQSLASLARTQNGLRTESKDLTGKLSQAKVFVQVIEQSIEKMKQASELMEQREAGAPTQAAVDGAASRFAQILDSLKADPAKKQNDQQQQEGEQGEGGGGGGNQGGGIPDIAQIKLLKLMQIEINDRTQILVDAKAKVGKWTPQQQKQFTQLSELQGRLAGLVLELSEPKGEPDLKDVEDPSKPVEKKK